MGKPRTKAQAERDRLQVSRMYNEGYIQFEISQKLGISQATVSRDIAFLIAQWQKDGLKNIDEQRTRELMRINKLEREYWEAWEASKAGKKVTHSKDVHEIDRSRQEIGERLEEIPGDPRYLAGVQWCISERCKLLGLNAPEHLKVDSTVTFAEVLQKASEKRKARKREG